MMLFEQQLATQFHIHSDKKYGFKQYTLIGLGIDQLS